MTCSSRAVGPVGVLSGWVGENSVLLSTYLISELLRATNCAVVKRTEVITFSVEKPVVVDIVLSNGVPFISLEEVLPSPELLTFTSCGVVMATGFLSPILLYEETIPSSVGGIMSRDDVKSLIGCVEV